MTTEILKPFGPSILKASIPDEIVAEMNKYVDELILDQEKISSAEVIAKFRQYTGYDPYFNYEKNSLESLAPSLS